MKIVNSQNNNMITQCNICKYEIPNNNYHCEIYSTENKPQAVLSSSKECKQFFPINPVIIKFENKKEKTIYDGLLGFIIGDALGVPVEFCTRKERISDPVKEMRAYGTYHQFFGTWSDDTSLTLATLQAFINGFTLEELSKQFTAYLENAKFTPYEKIFDIGIGTRKAILRMKKGIKPILAGGDSEYDNGNGSLMRILPLVFYLQNAKSKEIIEIVSSVSSLTHRTKRSILGCIIYVVFAINLLKGYNKKTSYKKTIKFILKNCKKTYIDEFDIYETILNRKLFSVYESDIHSSGYIVDTLTAAIWAFLTTETYSEAIFRAINLGGDTDTIAAITGGIAGIFYGYEAIPSQWIQTLARKEYLINIIKEFSKSI